MNGGSVSVIAHEHVSSARVDLNRTCKASRRWCAARRTPHVAVRCGWECRSYPSRICPDACRVWVRPMISTVHAASAPGQRPAPPVATRSSTSSLWVTSSRVAATTEATVSTSCPAR